MQVAGLCTILPDPMKDTRVDKKTLSLLYDIVRTGHGSTGCSGLHRENFKLFVPMPFDPEAVKVIMIAGYRKKRGSMFDLFPPIGIR